jgi:hypothetical protein
LYPSTGACSEQACTRSADLQKRTDKTIDQDFNSLSNFYQGIRHFASLKDKTFLTDSVSESIVRFAKHPRPIFLQVSDGFGPKRKDGLPEYLRSLPKDVQFFFFEPSND